MSIRGTLLGDIETRPKAKNPLRPRHTAIVPLLESQIPGKWLIFESRVYCVGTMLASDYQKMVQSHATTDYLAHILLGGIDTWDSWARWYAACELVRRGKIVLYDSRDEAERARRAG